MLFRRGSAFGLLRDVEERMSNVEEPGGGMLGVGPSTLGIYRVGPSTGLAGCVGGVGRPNGFEVLWNSVNRGVKTWVGEAGMAKR